jgi:hypothetical protein
MANLTSYDTAKLDFAFKDVYASDLMDLTPSTSRLQKDIKFVGNDQREGRAFVQPVRTTRPHGWTLDVTGGAYLLNDPEPSRGDEARVTGSSFLLQDVMSYDAAAKAVKGKRAFINGTSHMVEGMADMASFVLEMQLMHGQRDVGVLMAGGAGGTTSTQSFVFTVGSFIPALWSGLENGFVEFYTAGGAPLTPAGAKVTAVDIDARTVTFLGNTAELDAVRAGLGSAPQVYLRNTKAAGMVGLISQVSNTGVQFGIDAAEYSLWKGNTVTAGSATLTFQKIIRAADKTVVRGNSGPMRFYVSPTSWSDCMNDLSALRRYADKAGGKLEQGADELQFYGQNGSIVLVPHILMKPSEAFGIPTGGSKVKRLGASDITFSMPGTGRDKYFHDLPSHAGFGTRVFWHQAVFMSCPAQGVLVNNIVNTAA